MNITPTTVIEILGGTAAADVWGDPVEASTVVASGIPAAITETRQVIATESDSQAVAVHYYTGRVPAGTAVTKDQRVRDAAGNVYSIDYVNVPNAIGAPGDIRLDLRRVS